eukprot:m.127716 g.127716  ORF g.127716 m.127716 type:complete len:759 (-) comp22251_c0_seq1:40-2316(-)
MNSFAGEELSGAVREVLGQHAVALGVANVPRRALGRHATLPHCHREVVVPHGAKEKQRSEGGDNAHDTGHADDLGEVPLVRQRRRNHLVVRQRHCRQVKDEAHQNDEQRRETEVGPGNCGEEECEQVHAHKDSVDQVVLEPLKNLARPLDGRDDDGETRGEQDAVGGTLGSRRGALDGKPNVGLAECRGVVHAVSSHARDVALLLEQRHNVKLVLWEDLGKAVAVLDQLHQTSLGKLERVRLHDLVAHSKPTARLLGDELVIARDHLDRRAVPDRGLNDNLRVVPRWVEERHHAHEVPLVANHLGDSHRPKPLARKHDHRLHHLVRDLIRIVRQLDNDLRRTLCHLDHLAVRAFHRRLGPLDDWVKRQKVELLEREQTGLIFYRVTAHFIDGVGVNGFRSKRCLEDHVLPVKVGKHVRSVDGKHVLGESTSFVRAQRGHAGELFDGRELGDDSVGLRHLPCTNRHGCRHNHWSGDRNGCNHEDHKVRDDLASLALGAALDFVSAVLALVQRRRGGDLDNDEQDVHEQGKREEEERDAVHDDLHLSLGLDRLDQRDSLAHLSLLANVHDEHVLLSPLDHSARVACVPWVLLHRERLASQARLVKITGPAIAQSSIGWNDVADFQDDEVTRDEFSGRQPLPFAVPFAVAHGCQRSLQRLDRVTSLERLVEAERRVERVEEEYHSAISPVFDRKADDDGDPHHCRDGVRVPVVTVHLLPKKLVPLLRRILNLIETVLFPTAIRLGRREAVVAPHASHFHHL